MPFAIETTHKPLIGAEEYIYFRAPTMQDAIELANWFSDGDFKWMYSRDGYVTMSRTVVENSTPMPLCPGCGVPAVVKPRNHDKRCKTIKEEQSDE